MLTFWEDIRPDGKESLCTNVAGEVLKRKVKHSCGCTVVYMGYGNDYEATKLPDKPCKACRKARR